MSTATRALEISTAQIKLKITVEEASKLRVHEEIIPSILSWLVEKIKGDGVFKDPVIVDEKTLIVLDGMHRVAAARVIGLKYIPVCLVDYDNPSIGLYTWSRVVKLKGGEARSDLAGARKRVLGVLSRLGYRLVSVPSLDTGLRVLSRREILGLVVLGKALTGLKSPSRDIKSIYENVKRVEEALSQSGFKVEYYTERESIEIVERGDAVAALIPPTILKSEVREVVLRGEVFVHKSTRHVIPARPLNVNTPLEWLLGDRDLEEVRALLVEHLSRRKVKVLPAGTVLDRRYDEELYVFE